MRASLLSGYLFRLCVALMLLAVAALLRQQSVRNRPGMIRDAVEPPATLWVVQ